MTPPFEIPIRVEPADIDGLGHVNNTVYLRWVQEVAVAHWKTIAPLADQAKLLWVVLRHEIDYRQPALPGDSLIARTWVGIARGLKFERYTEILRAGDRTALARALTLWCPIDPQSGRPTTVSPEVRAIFSAGDA
jgi:acyl-CoA thioester hydrolase